MINKNGALNLFIAYGEEADKFISLLENASYTLNPHVSEDEADLIQQLSESTLDLILVNHTESNAQLIKTTFSELRKRNLDIPVILVNPTVDSNKVVQGLRMGAIDVCTLDDDQHLLQIVSRALYDLEQRRNRAYWKRQFKDSEHRNQKLMDSSRDAIALIAEGTYVYVNESYAHLFGYDDSDELLLSPVIDTAQQDFMEQLKPYLKPLLSEEALPSKTLEFEGLRQDGSLFSIEMELAQIEYEGEPALQFLANKEKLATLPLPSQTTSGSVDTSLPAEGILPSPTCKAGDINLQRALSYINTAIRKASKSHANFLVYYLRIEDFAALRDQRGFLVSEATVQAVANFINNHLTPDEHLNRIEANAFLLLTTNKDPEVAKQYAHELLESCTNEVFEIEGQTVTVRLNAGASTVDQSFEHAEVCIDRCLKAIAGLDSEKNTASQVQLFEELFPTSMATLGEDKNILQYVKQLMDKELLSVHYQPIVALQNQEFEYYEAFCQPNIDNLPEGIPEDFFTKAFKTDIAFDLDKWILLRVFKELQNKITSHPATRIFVKISGPTLKNNAFLGWVEAALKATTLNPQQVIFQLEEKNVSWALNDTMLLIEGLQKANAEIALTHHGVDPGIDTLKKVNFDFVKPDQALVAKAGKTTEGVEALSDCINAAKGEGVKIVVPFVEDASTIPTLWKLGVDYIQGRYIQEPQQTMAYEFSEEE